MPPICAVPSEPIDSGSRQPASAAASCAARSVTPASTVSVMSTGSIARTVRIRSRLMTTCRPSSDGTAPPTIDVLPPCGTIATPAAAQQRIAAAS